MALNIEFKNQSKRVRVSPATTLFQVVESSRELFGLDAATPCELLHRGRCVDLSIPFRLTGISNNAALELRETGGVAAPAQQVRIAVQLRDGKRVQQSFASDATLERLLTALGQLPVETGQEFSLTYMQREIAFDAFASTTLQELGIVSGSAMFRMSRAAPLTALAAAPAAQAPPTPAPAPARAPENVSSPSVAPAQTVSCDIHEPVDEEEEKQSAPLSHQDVVARRAAAPAPAPAPAPSPAPVQEPAPIEQDAVSTSREDVEMTSVEPPAPLPLQKLSSYHALQLLRDSCFDSVSRTAVITLMKIVTNILSHPENEKLRSIRMSNAAFERNVGQHKGGVEFLISTGFTLNEESHTLKLSSVGAAETMSLQKALNVLNVEADDLRIDLGERPQVVVPIPVNEAFDAYKPIITRIQAQPRGPSATEVLVDNLKTKQEELMQRVVKPARSTTVVFPGQQQQAPTVGQMDVDMTTSHEDTRSDSSLVIASMKARRVEMEKAQNFRTQAMRELDELKRKKVFQQALIRVQFPDRVVVQAAFHPMETVADVVAHVRECLDAQVSSAVSFYLYVSPPLLKLAPEKTLSKLGLVPAAHTYLSWIEGPPAPDQSQAIETRGAYLRQDLLTPNQPDSKSSSGLPAPLYPNSIALDEAEAAKAKAAKNSAFEAAQKRAAAGESKPKSSKKPSWFKL